MSVKVVVKHGTCSWTDPTLVSGGKFYPKGCSKANERLKFYANQYSTVEVDSSSYAIPQRKSNEEWADSTPEGFIFHFKAYGLLTLLGVPLASLPWQVREKLPDILKAKEQLTQTDLGTDVVKDVFDIQNDAFEPFHAKKKLGFVVFQFQADVKCCDESWAYVVKCRQQLKADFKMAVEFRATSWFAPQSNLDETIARCKAASITLIGVDELIIIDKKPNSIEVINGKLREYPPGGGRGPKKVLVCSQTTPNDVVLRLHRREGEDRRLDQVELEHWARALRELADAATADTTVWMLWNTNYDNHSFVNAARLTSLIEALKSPRLVVCNWKAIVRAQEATSKKSLLGFFRPKAAGTPAAGAAAVSSSPSVAERSSSTSVTPASPSSNSASKSPSASSYVVSSVAEAELPKKRPRDDDDDDGDDEDKRKK